MGGSVDIKEAGQLIGGWSDLGPWAEVEDDSEASVVTTEVHKRWYSYLEGETKELYFIGSKFRELNEKSEFSVGWLC